MRYFIIDGERFESEQDAAQFIVDNYDDTAAYDEMLRDCYGDKDGNIDICGLSYDAAYALERLDPIAYRCGFTDYMDAIYGDIEYDMERMDHEDEENIYGFTVKCVDEEDEDETAA